MLVAGTKISHVAVKDRHPGIVLRHNEAPRVPFRACLAASVALKNQLLVLSLSSATVEYLGSAASSASTASLDSI